MEFLEHIIDKYGFATAVAAWMLYRDYKFIAPLCRKLQIMNDLLAEISGKVEDKRNAN